MYRFLLIIERGEASHGAYSPDIPDCVIVGKTWEMSNSDRKRSKTCLTVFTLITFL